MTGPARPEKSRPAPAGTRVRPLLAEASARLAAAGIDSARTDAELLLAHVLHRARSTLVLQDDVGPAAARRFGDLLERRAAREPLQYLLGSAAFRHVELAVGPGVFIPRPETELLVDAVLPLPPGAVAVDLCAGSGALGVALADETRGVSVVAVERSAAALGWLRRNAGDRVTVVAGDVADPDLLADLAGRVDAVLSNPPYVPDAAPVGPEVRHDPGEAVFAGPDGLSLMPAVIAAAARLLRPGGVLALEHDDSHAEAVPALLRATGRFTDVADRPDLGGRPRFATARRR